MTARSPDPLVIEGRFACCGRLVVADHAPDCSERAKPPVVAFALPPVDVNKFPVPNLKDPLLPYVATDSQADGFKPVTPAPGAAGTRGSHIDRIARELGLSPEQRDRLVENYAGWSDALKPFEEALERSGIITAADMQTRVGAPSAPREAAEEQQVRELLKDCADKWGFGYAADIRKPFEDAIVAIVATLRSRAEGLAAENAEYKQADAARAKHEVYLIKHILDHYPGLLTTGYVAGFALLALQQAEADITLLRQQLATARSGVEITDEMVERFTAYAGAHHLHPNRIRIGLTAALRGGA